MGRACKDAWDLLVLISSNAVFDGLVTFATQTARVFGFDECLVRPVPSRSFTSLAPRPRDTSFVTTKMQRQLGIRPLGVTEGLSLMYRTRLVVAGSA